MAAVQVVDLLSSPEDCAEGGEPTGGGTPAGGATPTKAREDPRQEEWQGVGLDPKRKVPVINSLRVREHPKQGVHVEGLTRVPVKEMLDVQRALEQGTALRRVRRARYKNCPRRDDCWF